jgi:hypothetical protein
MPFSSISASTLITFSKIIKNKNIVLPKKSGMWAVGCWPFCSKFQKKKLKTDNRCRVKTEDYRDLKFSIFRLSEKERATNFPAKRSLQPQRTE